LNNRHILLIFLDGVGLGDDDPAKNPFSVAETPTLNALAGGHRWVRSTGMQVSDRAIFIPTDPRMGIPGRPQSASGQATILTGRNIPQLIGEHYGPRPNLAIRELLAQDNFFKQVVAHGLTAALIEAYPPPFHHSINSGKRLRSSYQQALHEAGLPLFGEEMIYSGDALAVDWTGEGWRLHLGYTDTPIYTPPDAGRRMVEISRRYDFAFFSHWMSDTVGHRGTVQDGARLLEIFDGVMQGALETWQDDEGLIIITSDHGNLEDLSHGKHTENDVATVVIGAGKESFVQGLVTLADLVPRMGTYLFAED
jgi:bisphosphoglycerate-independent phosphoglycerate mutase (AlkP superfamily)